MITESQATQINALILAGKHSEAEEALASHCMGAEQNHSLVLRLSGNLAVAKQQPELAISLYRQSLSYSPFDHRTLNNLAQILFRLGRFREAIDLFEKCIELEPSSYLYLSGYVECCLSSHLFEVAINKILASPLRCQNQSQLLLARCYNSDKSFDKALPLLRKLYSEQQDIDILLELSVALAGIHEYDEAINMIESSTHNYKRESGIRRNYASLLHLKGRFTEAETIAVQLCNEDPSDSASADLAASIYLDQGKYSLAQSLLERLAQKCTLGHRSLVLYANCLMSVGSFADGWVLGRKLALSSHAVLCENTWVESFLHKTEALPVWDPTSRSSPAIIYLTNGVGDQLLYMALFMYYFRDSSHQYSLILDGRLKALLQPYLPHIRFYDYSQIPLIDASRYSCKAFIEDLFITVLKSTKDLVPAASILSGVLENPGTKQKTDCYIQQVDKQPIRIGLSWRSTNPTCGDAKSIDLSKLLDSLTKVDAQFVNLQYDITPTEQKILKDRGMARIENPGLDLKNNFVDLAIALQACDMVVTVSNVTVHFSGIFGIPTFLLTSKYGASSMWYWNHIDQSSHSLIYPSVRIIAKKSSVDPWEDVLFKLRSAIIDKIES